MSRSMQSVAPADSRTRVLHVAFERGSTALAGAAGWMRSEPRLSALGGTMLAEVLLLLMALMPASIWASHSLPDGPIPRSLSPLVAGAFYGLPALTGLLCRRWQAAIVLATLPAWLDLGLFAIVAATRIGPFYLATDPHAVSTVGTLELFAVLGGLGWLARSVVRTGAERREPGQP